MILHLGVIDVPYVEPPATPKAPKNPRRRRRGPHKAHAAKYANITTGDVATILEDKYGIMQAYFAAHEADVASAIEGSLQGAVESLLMGGPPKLDAFGSAVSKIEDGFRRFLSEREVERVGIPGTPTAAALRGVSHRFKQAYKLRARRPSFIDTGLYEASFKSWITA
jgi:hypothetical protein